MFNFFLLPCCFFLTGSDRWEPVLSGLRAPAHPHHCYAAVTLLLRCCYTALTHRCYPPVTPLLHTHANILESRKVLLPNFYHFYSHNWESLLDENVEERPFFQTRQLCHGAVLRSPWFQRPVDVL